MRIDARDGSGIGWTVFDLDKGEKIPLCIWADDETGEYEHYVPNADGKPQLDPNDQRQAWRQRGQGRIVLVPPGHPLPTVMPQTWRDREPLL